MARLIAWDGPRTSRRTLFRWPVPGGGPYDRRGLMVGVTNLLTRVPAVTAGAIATVHSESGGRAVLGLGKATRRSVTSVGAITPV